MNRTFSALVVAATAALSLAASAANAAIFIGLQQDGGPIVPAVPIASGPGFAVSSAPFGEFELVTVTGFGQPLLVPPPLLIGTASVSNNAGGSAGLLTIYITSTDNTVPIGSVQFTSDFTAINLTAGWTETVQTFLDPANGVFTTPGAPLGQVSFNATGHDTDIVNRDTGAGPYSKTAVLSISAPSLGASNTSVGLRGVANAVPIPEPASLALLGAALSGFGIAVRRRRPKV
jgi:hypothetical protein